MKPNEFRRTHGKAIAPSLGSKAFGKLTFLECFKGALLHNVNVLQEPGFRFYFFLRLDKVFGFCLCVCFPM